MKLKIRLDHDDIKCLIGGGALTITVPHEPQAVVLYMADIGFHNIDRMMDNIESKKEKPYQDHERLNQVGWDE